jgi:hypothetical protein
MHVNGGPSRVLFIKVLDVGTDKAHAFVVSERSDYVKPKDLKKQGQTAIVMEFEPRYDGWAVNGEYEEIWGSGEGNPRNIFPPYPDQSYFRK